MKTLFRSRLALFIALVGITFSCKKNENATGGNYNQDIDTVSATPDSIGTVTDSTVMGNKNMKTTTNSNSPNTYNGAGASNSSGSNNQTSKNNSNGSRAGSQGSNSSKATTGKNSDSTTTKNP